MIIGDFNLPDIDWDLLNDESRQSTNFCELIVHLNLCQLITSSTHNAGNILDLILTNNDQLVHDIVIHYALPSSLSSDHFIITFKVLVSSLTKVQVPQESTPNYSKANWEAMNTFFNQYDFGKLYGTSDLEYAWNCLKRIIFEAILQFVPKTCSRRYPVQNGLIQRFNTNLIKCTH